MSFEVKQTCVQIRTVSPGVYWYFVKTEDSPTGLIPVLTPLKGHSGTFLGPEDPRKSFK